MDFFAAVKENKTNFMPGKCLFHISDRVDISLIQESSEKEETASMELNQTSIRYYDKRFSRLSTGSETADAIVPDTFPDIGRVVCAYGMAAVRDQSPQSGRLLISGMVQTVVLYEPEKGEGLRRLTVPVSFCLLYTSRCV